MRLLNTQTLGFQQFYDTELPKYIILSHRWGTDEATYQNFADQRYQDSAGYAKVINFCRFARERGYQWVWIDTCCIDKTSSAELTESINSMWNYYCEATECIAYLSDVQQGNLDWTLIRNRTADSTSEFHQSALLVFGASKWFTRGWTLQELLAPRILSFCSSDWKILGTKKDLQKAISIITGIRHMYLQPSGPEAIRGASIAEIMSWASARVTQRTEDIAYCLLGLFGVNMPLLYGERHKAFLRLQLEIIKKTDDQSIFAWADEKESSGMLASSPEAFRCSSDFIGFGKLDDRTPPYQMTNKGLEINFRRTPSLDSRRGPCAACGRHRRMADATSIIAYGAEDARGPGDGLNARYRDPEALIAQNCRAVLLACGRIDAVDTKSEPSFKVVSVTLHKLGLIWQRANCERLELIDVNSDDRTSNGDRLLHRYKLSRYYIPQVNL